MQERLLNLYQQVERASLVLKKFNTAERKHIQSHVVKNSLPNVLIGTYATIKSSDTIDNLIALRQELAVSPPPDKLTQSYVKYLHKKLFKGLLENPAGYSQVDRCILRYKYLPGQNRELLGTKKIRVAPPELCEKAVKDMLVWYNTPSNQDGLLKAIELLLRFVQIHPFDDGNGRVARCLFLVALMHSSSKALREIVPYLIIEYELEKDKTEWGRLVEASGNFNEAQIYNLEKINQFVLDVFEKSVDDLIKFLEFLHKKSAEICRP